MGPAGPVQLRQTRPDYSYQEATMFHAMTHAKNRWLWRKLPRRLRASIVSNCSDCCIGKERSRGRTAVYLDHCHC